MYVNNLPAKFTTKFGSLYEVRADGLKRIPYHMTVEEQNKRDFQSKNIFYAACDLSEMLLNFGEGRRYWKIGYENKIFKYSVFFCIKNGGNKLFSGDLTQLPSNNRVPVDMRLRDDGRFEEDHGFHVGDVITSIEYPKVI